MANERFGRILRTASEKAKEAATVLREEFAKGVEGDTSPTPVLFGTTGYDQIKALLARKTAGADDFWAPGSDTGSDQHADAAGHGSSPADEAAWGATMSTGAGEVAENQGGRWAPPSTVPAMSPSVELVAWEGVDLDDESAAAEVSGVLQRIDWRAVSASAQERTGEVAERMKSLAGDVDWEKMKPVAGKVASALVAAAATGQIGRLSGPTAIAVSRALQGNSVGEAAAAMVVRKGPAGVVAGEVMKTFLKPPTTPPSPPPTSPRYQGPNVFEANLADLDTAARD